jgi:hypothetical protein
MKRVFITIIFLTICSPAIAQNNNYVGQYTVNPYANNAVKPYTYGGGDYASGSNSPKLYDSQGNFRGNLNSNPYDPDSVANPYGRYGSEYSSDSINNSYGAGNPYNQDSPYNPYGQGLSIYD